jgi:quercetin dioxygenase-like cupin family protein
MRKLLAKLINGEISRRDFTARMLGMGFGMMTVESMLDNTALGAEKKQSRTAAQTFRAEPFSEKTPYEQWMSGEGIPVHGGYFVADVRVAELKPWKRLGAKGALIDLEGAEATDGAYLLEIGAGAVTNAQRYMFEESIYVLDGEGETTVWHENRPKQTFKWKQGTLFSPPLNTWRVHKNPGHIAARLISFTDLPLVMDLYHNADFIFNNDFVFRDRYNNQPDYFTVNQSKMKIAGSAATFGEGEKGAVGVLDTGLIPDLNQIQLFAAKARGLKNKSAEVVLSDNSMQTHVSEFEVGTYKRAHRHGPGSHVLAMGGVGYSLMWTNAPRYSEAMKKVRVDWKDGTLFVPPDRWFHQHFNTGENSAKYMATTWIGGKYWVKGMGGGGRTHRLNTVPFHAGGNMIDYQDEDPAIREMFEAELKSHGVDIRMPDRKGQPK